jgi:hypothetical protein
MIVLWLLCTFFATAGTCAIGAGSFAPWIVALSGSFWDLCFIGIGFSPFER